MPCRTREPDLIGDVQLPHDPGHWLLMYYFPRERLMIRARMAATRRGYAALLRDFDRGCGIPTSARRPPNGCCYTRKLKARRGRRTWLVIDLLYCRPILRERRAVLWHEAVHALDGVIYAKRVPEWRYLSGSPLDLPERIATFGSGLMEGLSRWWGELSTLKPGQRRRSKRDLAFERVV